MNVEIAMEYCRQFHVETSYALECFITAVLLAPTTSPQDLEWARRVRLATTKVNTQVASQLVHRRNFSLPMVPIRSMKHLSLNVFKGSFRTFILLTMNDNALSYHG